MVGVRYVYAIFCSICGSQNGRKNHLRLMFEREGGGGGGRCVETAENNTSGSRLNVREVVVVAGDQNASGKGHLALAVFRCFSCPMAS